MKCNTFWRFFIDKGMMSCSVEKDSLRKSFMALVIIIRIVRLMDAHASLHGSSEERSVLEALSDC